MSRRTERLGSLLQQELAAIIQRELVDPRITGFPSITKVRVAEDLATADVYLTIMGTPGQQSAALNAIRHSGGMMRSRLTKELSIRQVPFLKFHIDEQLRRELDVLKLLSKVQDEELEMTERAAKQAEIDAALDAKRAVKDAARETRRLAREAGEEVADESTFDGDELGEDDFADGDEHAGGDVAGDEVAGDDGIDDESDGKTASEKHP